MKVLIIGGTGTISAAVVKTLARKDGVELYVLNRGNRELTPFENVTYLKCDVNDTEQTAEMLRGLSFDVVCNFIVYTPQQAQSMIDLFSGKTGQYIHISSVAAYNHEFSCVLEEKNQQGNRFNAYAQNKQEVEEVFLRALGEKAFPVTIVRPSQTYSRDRIPLSVKGKTCWSVISRMLRGKEVIVHDGGQTVWASTHADDFAEGFSGLVGNRNAIGEAYQIVNNSPHTWDMVYYRLAELLKVEYRPVYITSDQLSRSKKYDLTTSILGDKHFSCIYSTDKIKNTVPGFRCKISIDEGLERYLAFMDENPQLKIEDEEFDAWCDRTIASYHAAMAAFEVE